MAGNNAEFHESEERLRPQTMEYHRAIASLMEELEAVDWYQQRMDATEDSELREILRHNRDEEKEHAAMVLEWIRRRDDGFSGVLKTYLFSEGSITELEDVMEKGTGNGAGAQTGMRASIGSLRGGPR